MNDSEQTENITMSEIIDTNNNMKTYSHNDKKMLVKRIEDIKNRQCYLKILKVIHGDNFKFTKNDNGVFFNVSNLPDSILFKIDSIVQYYENKKIRIETLKSLTNINE